VIHEAKGETRSDGLKDKRRNSERNRKEIYIGQASTTRFPKLLKTSDFGKTESGRGQQ
jgi:hypothetical protein